jgi:ADP-heptose:LPS heptosyltransferase
VAVTPTLVVLRALGLGDFLTGLPALRALADAYPRHRRVLLAPAALESLVRLAGGPVELRDYAPFAEPPRDLSGADIAVNLHGAGPESHAVLLALEPPRLIAFEHPEVPESAGCPGWTADEHEVARWCRLLEESGVPADARRLELALPEHPNPAPGATVVHPGAKSPTRRWPPERFAAVARAELAAGRRVVVTGSAAEARLARAVARAAGVPEDDCLAGDTDLGELTALVAGAARVVCGDTGVAHLATALGTPSVVLFGPEPPSRWGPPSDRPLHVSLWAGIDCPGNGGVHPGLLAVEVADVLAALARLDARAARQAPRRRHSTDERRPPWRRPARSPSTT